jgi:acyl-coenzyme A synthetase/AMP-(fatty) acid ligase
MLLNEIEKEERAYDLSSIRVCFSAGEALPKHLYERWHARFGLPILDGVGSTDVGGIYLSNRPGHIEPGSSGQLLDGFEGKLLDTDGQEVRPNEVGTLWLRNDGIASGYWNKHQRNKEVFKGDWFNTGDQFSRDTNGYFWYQGREDDMLKVSGQWVSPLEIESTLQQHPAVRECGVVGAPDEAGLVKVKAFVVLKDGYSTSPELEKELAAFVHDRIAHFKTPRWVRCIPEMPRTVTGKLRRHELRKIIT